MARRLSHPENKGSVISGTYVYAIANALNMLFLNYAKNFNITLSHDEFLDTFTDYRFHAAARALQGMVSCGDRRIKVVVNGYAFDLQLPYGSNKIIPNKPVSLLDHSLDIGKRLTEYAEQRTQIGEEWAIAKFIVEKIITPEVKNMNGDKSWITAAQLQYIFPAIKQVISYQPGITELDRVSARMAESAGKVPRSLPYLPREVSILARQAATYISKARLMPPAKEIKSEFEVSIVGGKVFTAIPEQDGFKAFSLMVE